MHWLPPFEFGDRRDVLGCLLLGGTRWTTAAILRLDLQVAATSAWRILAAGVLDLARGDKLSDVSGGVAGDLSGFRDRQRFRAECFERALQLDGSESPESCTVGIAVLLEPVRSRLPDRKSTLLNSSHIPLSPMA